MATGMGSGGGERQRLLPEVRASVVANGWPGRRLLVLAAVTLAVILWGLRAQYAVPQVVVEVVVGTVGSRAARRRRR
ncbi:hypothetical protein [Paractinoplanes hotanensis]|uniref:Uncharacterized protein n=1 Tax=Paractinoplanes hotanensis TaxID=2906497 RepID=A0ABT0Y772_9ACTN|nr:hypothetical protein [Actinoplanes hotanensis]MCM4081650.1 hypothetical protein [Actinoplanes hotanensis]